MFGVFVCCIFGGREWIMSLERFRKHVERLKPRSPNEEWSVRWLKRMFEFWGCPVSENLSFDAQRLIEFLKTMRDRGVPAWQRHQAAVSAGRYQVMLTDSLAPEFKEVIGKLANLAAAERNGDASAATHETHFPANERPALTELRKTLRRGRYKFATEKAYVGWSERFLNAYPNREIDTLGEPEIREFLSSLVMDERGGVSASTLNQAKSALLFLFKQVLGRDLAFLEHSAATKPKKLPVVLTEQEISAIRQNLSGLKRMMLDLMYGGGLRHKECRRLRIKDMQIEEGTILVRDGKGEKDRITVLPIHVRQRVIEQIERCRRRHARDLAMGGAEVFLPDALARKYPNESTKFGWQWLFPSPRCRRDPRTGKLWRHHVSDDFLSKCFAKALLATGCVKNAVPHTLRQACSYYDSSLRMGYLKGNSGCEGSGICSWRPLRTASTAAWTSGSESDSRSMIQGVDSTTCLAGNTRSRIKRRTTV
jgi:integron integrase